MLCLSSPFRSQVDQISKRLPCSCGCKGGHGRRCRETSGMLAGWLSSLPHLSRSLKMCSLKDTSCGHHFHGVCASFPPTILSPTPLLVKSLRLQILIVPGFYLCFQNFRIVEPPKEEKSVNRYTETLCKTGLFFKVSSGHSPFTPFSWGRDISFRHYSYLKASYKVLIFNTGHVWVIFLLFCTKVLRGRTEKHIF